MYPIAFITALGFGALGTIGSILFYIDSWKSLHLIEGISHKFLTIATILGFGLFFMPVIIASFLGMILIQKTDSALQIIVKLAVGFASMFWVPGIILHLWFSFLVWVYR
ncbi:MAG: hypothetical protein QM472_02785 [Spirochaetota bacterium]|nr:hypothetical protein [Spirochaetota bacterium]OPZ19797.1 MAG: hypothetical protein BWZ03_00869 [bacterium ADurb.BinA186]HPV96737.1 hypothetical protein [Spirochaetota bacterium]